MKVKYVGKKQLMNVLLPVGTSRAAKRGVLTFAPGQVQEMSDEDGAKLIHLNRHSNNYVIVDDTAKPAKEAVVEAHVEEKVEAKPKSRGHR